MSKKFKNYSEVSKMVVVATIVGIILCLFSIIGVCFGQPGWLIGVAIGSVIEVLNIFFLYKGSDMALQIGKTPLFLIFYFARMILFAGGIIFAVVMQYVCHIAAFTNSFWGVLIGYTPMQIIVIVIMAKTGKSPLNMRENNDNGQNL